MTEEMKKERERLLEAVEDVSPLLAPLGLASKRMKEALEREAGVSAHRWLVLTVLVRRDGLSQGEVGKLFEVDPAQFTRLGQALEKEGLIRRERDPEDNRVVRMYLTDEGRRTVRELSSLEESFRGRINAVLSEEEVGELRRMLGLLSDAFQD
jgi:DNA-binding MarR family transcriptional regulator